ncbi:MAG: hypothetical protein KBF17_11210 [Candidatus Promineofilum sp.]|nr:hypothetical protein [Promineifilum sp.]
MADMPLIAKVSDDDFLAFLREEENELWEVEHTHFGNSMGSPLDVEELFDEILAHRGAEEEKFIYVFDPFEVAFESAHSDVDWLEIPIITRSQLSDYYASSRPGRNAFMFECSSVGAGEGIPIYLYPVIDPDTE